MNKFKATMKVITRFVDDNLPTILSGLALVGLGASVVSAVKETPKAQEEVKKAKSSKMDEIELAANNDEHALDIYRNDDGELDSGLVNLTLWEKFKILAPVYWKTATLTVLTGACIITSNLVSKRRYLGLAALVAAKSKELDEYKDKAKELFGEKKAEQVEKELVKDRGLECPRDIESRYQPGMVYPLEFCGHYWLGTQHEVEKAFDRWNRGGLDEAMKTVDGDVELYLEDLIYELKLNIPDTWVFRHTSWSVNKGSVDAKFEPWETANGVPGFSIVPSRPADNYS